MKTPEFLQSTGTVVAASALVVASFLNTQPASAQESTHTQAAEPAERTELLTPFTDNKSEEQKNAERKWIAIGLLGLTGLYFYSEDQNNKNTEQR